MSLIEYHIEAFGRYDQSEIRVGQLQIMIAKILACSDEGQIEAYEAFMMGRSLLVKKKYDHPSWRFERSSLEIRISHGDTAATVEEALPSRFMKREIVTEVHYFIDGVKNQLSLEGFKKPFASDRVDGLWGFKANMKILIEDWGRLILTSAAARFSITKEKGSGTWETALMSVPPENLLASNNQSYRIGEF